MMRLDVRRIPVPVSKSTDQPLSSSFPRRREASDLAGEGLRSLDPRLRQDDGLKMISTPAAMRNVASGFILLFAAMSPVSAQESSEPPVAPSATTDNDDPLTLDAVIVTAQRRSEDARQMPLSVSVIAPEQLQAIGASARDIIGLGAPPPSFYPESSLFVVRR